MLLLDQIILLLYSRWQSLLRAGLAAARIHTHLEQHTAAAAQLVRLTTIVSWLVHICVLANAFYLFSSVFVSVECMLDFFDTVLDVD